MNGQETGLLSQMELSACCSCFVAHVFFFFFFFFFFFSLSLSPLSLSHTFAHNTFSFIIMVLIGYQMMMSKDYFIVLYQTINIHLITKRLNSLCLHIQFKIQYGIHPLCVFSDMFLFLFVVEYIFDRLSQNLTLTSSWRLFFVFCFVFSPIYFVTTHRILLLLMGDKVGNHPD